MWGKVHFDGNQEDQTALPCGAEVPASHGEKGLQLAVPDRK